ncbi:MAG TPA: glucosamine-6-phosphate deaminase [Chloroflexota bacterium]|nr:glucosamine-6-phosphate deaminase [Chloroflexota bacterium]
MSAGDADVDSRPDRVERFENLLVEIHPDRRALGRAAGRAAARRMRQELAGHDRIAVMFAAAPSQNEFLATLGAESDLDWSRVIAFHMDEYIGLPAGALQSFGHYLRSRLFDRVKPGVIHFLDGNATDPEAEARRYADLLKAQPLDLAFVGIGENGHLAFNDPPIADFADPLAVKIVEMDDISRLQQVHDGAFARVDEMPRRALTVTIPPLVGARMVSATVPGPTKITAIRDTLRGPIASTCPASILRRHRNAVLYLDRDSAALI